MQKKLSNSLFKIYLCAGGTGGHLFPAIATARALLKARTDTEITVISDKRVSEPNVNAIKLFIPRRSKKIQVPLFIFAMFWSFLRCFYLFLTEKPSIVVGFGGYPSVPAVLAAQMLGIPTILHEQNAYIGRANRSLLKRARHVALSFEKTMAFDTRISHCVTGNPARIHPCTPYQPKKNHLSLFATGGSQGAAFFSTLLPEALSLLSAQKRKNITLVQQCRAELLESTQKSYDDLGMHVTLKPFFDHVQELYEKADLVIARAGASTVSELTIAGRAALFIPYPYATDHHQLYNAKALGDACFLEEQKNLTPQKLAEILQKSLNQPEILEKKAKDIQNYSMVQAASHLAQVIQDLLPPLETNN